MIDGLHIKPLTPFDSQEPSKNHEQKFLRKLQDRFHHIISIVPYLIRVFIVTVIVFSLSVLVWYKYIHKDHQITLREKIINIKNNR